MTEMAQLLTENLINILIYGATGIITFVGFIKCVFPLRRCARFLRHAVHVLEAAVPAEVFVVVFTVVLGGVPSI